FTEQCAAVGAAALEGAKPRRRTYQHDVQAFRGHCMRTRATCFGDQRHTLPRLGTHGTATSLFAPCVVAASPVKLVRAHARLWARCGSPECPPLFASRSASPLPRASHHLRRSLWLTPTESRSREVPRRSTLRPW